VRRQTATPSCVACLGFYFFSARLLTTDEARRIAAIAVDIHRVGNTMAACSPSLISQLRTVWDAADRVLVEKRGIFLERVVARLQLQRGLTNADLDDAVRSALTGLIHSAA